MNSLKDQMISLEALNELLSTSTKSKYFVNKIRSHTGIPDNYHEPQQGEFNETLKYYRHPEFPENIFLQETWQTDSYADNDSIVDIKLVEGKSKQITVFEPINK